MWFDITVLAIVLAALITGAVSGIIRQMGTLMGFVVALLACRMGARPLAALLGAESAWAVGGCYVLVFVVSFLAVWLLARLLKATVHAIKLGAVDRILGALFRTFVWIVIMSVCLNVWLTFFPDSRSTFEQPGRPWRTWLVDTAPFVVGYVAGSSAEGH